MKGLRKVALILLCAVLFSTGARAADSADLFGGDKLEGALPREARQLIPEADITAPGTFSDGLSGLLTGAADAGQGYLRQALRLCMEIMAVVLLSAVLRGVGNTVSRQTVALAASLAVGVLCVGRISGFFSMAAKTVDSMTAFSGLLYMALAAATAATGAPGTASALYGVTVLVCTVMTKLVQTLLLPAISCYMALMIASAAVGEDGLKMAADTLKQLLVSGLKLCVILFTAYLSVTGVISGSADTAAVKAAKLTISTTVPVVGSLIADASETLLVSASMLKSGIGVFGLLGVLAVSILPFLETGIQYLMLKLTAAASGVVGEKQLTGLIDAMAGAMGLLTAVTGVCTLMLLIGCVCFMKVTVGV